MHIFFKLLFSFIGRSKQIYFTCFWLIIHISKFLWGLFLLSVVSAASQTWWQDFLWKAQILSLCMCVCVCAWKFLRQEWRWILPVSICLCQASESITSSSSEKLKLNTHFENFFKPRQTLWIWAINWSEEWLVGITYRILFVCFSPPENTALGDENFLLVLPLLVGLGLPQTIKMKYKYTRLGKYPQVKVNLCALLIFWGSHPQLRSDVSNS